jgi:hypothetical protein
LKQKRGNGGKRRKSAMPAIKTPNIAPNRSHAHRD